MHEHVEVRHVAVFVPPCRWFLHPDMANENTTPPKPMAHALDQLLDAIRDTGRHICRCRPVHRDMRVQRVADREQLALALGEAKRIKGTLVIAKLDRLARDVHFVSGLMKSGVDFVAADMPSADKTMIQIFAVMGEWERDRISERTKAALATAKARGVKLGNPVWAETIGKARAANRDRARAWAENMLPTIRSIQVQGQPRPSLREIAAELNRRGIRTARGGKWYASTVQRVIEAG